MTPLEIVLGFLVALLVALFVCVLVVAAASVKPDDLCEGDA